MTAREFAQTLELLERNGIEHRVVGPAHGGGGVIGKARAMAGRLPALRRFAKGRRFDLALAHGSHEVMLAARSLGIRGATAHDYEFATLQHQLGLRAATPRGLPRRRSAGAPEAARGGAAEARPVPRARGGVLPRRLRARPSGARRDRPGPACSSSSGPRPTSRSTTGTRTRSSPGCSSGSAATRPCTRSSCRAPPSSASAIRGLELPSLHVAEHAVDAQSLVALADLVVSAGGTMNREAVALGTPVYTTFAGRLGAVDEALIREGRLQAADRPGRARAAASASRARPRACGATRACCSTCSSRLRAGPAWAGPRTSVGLTARRAGRRRPAPPASARAM